MFVKNLVRLVLAAVFYGGLVCSATPVDGQEVKHEGNYILNLYDAFGSDVAGVTRDFGFSALIVWNGRTILFDAGTNADILKRNVEALGVRLEDVDFAVASHSHFDHINGFDYLLEVNPEVTIYFPNDPFFGAPLPFDVTGMDPDAAEDLPARKRYFNGEKTRFTFNQSGRFWKANIQYVRENTEILPGVHLIATRSPFTGYFSRYPNLDISGKESDADIKTMGLPELSLSLSTAAGEVLVVGCSHSLVESIAREANAYLKDRDIALVMGGFHLLPYAEEEIRGMAMRMREDLGVQRVAPAHCTGHLGFKVFEEVYGVSYREAGLGSYVKMPTR